MSRASFVSFVLLTLVVAWPARAQYQYSAKDIRFRSGNIVVRRAVEPLAGEKEVIHLRHHGILRDQIDFGRCYEDAKYRRLAITYYHPRGPLGVALGRFNWFPGPVNTYYADARLPAALVGLSAPGCAATFPVHTLVGLWSEPPVAVIGLNAGTPAAYARPFQHFHFYEPTRQVIQLNERDEKERFFHFVPDARARGATVEIIHGPPRQRLHEQGPRRFYHLMILEACSGENGEKIYLDLFTKEGIAQCFEHLTEDGILCVHTSHRFVNLPPVLAAIANALSLHVRRGHDQAPGNYRLGRGTAELAELGHYTSEWVMLSRNREILLNLREPPDYAKRLRADLAERRRLGIAAPEETYWSTPMQLDSVWTDKGPNLLHGVLRGHPFAMRYSAVAVPCADLARRALIELKLDSPEARELIQGLTQLPPTVHDFLVQQQLKWSPQLEKLWP